MLVNFVMLVNFYVVVRTLFIIEVSWNYYFLVLLKVQQDLIFYLNLDLKIFIKIDKITIIICFHL
jgi:hypothetical protein